MQQGLYPSSYAEHSGFVREYKTLPVIIMMFFYEAELAVGSFVFTIFLMLEQAISHCIVLLWV